MNNEIWICAAGLGLSSLLGSALGALIKNIPHKWNDIFLGYCGGMMLAAAIISMLDHFTPHLHRLSGLEDMEHHSTKSANRVLLFVMAIAIHKFPEGVATGISFDGGDSTGSYSLAIAIALQNIPEGMVVVTPLILVGIKGLRVLLVSLSVALLETVGVIAGYMLGEISSMLLPFLLATAGGAMLYVISDEMIPETHAHGFEKLATYALIAGVMTMLSAANRVMSPRWEARPRSARVRGSPLMTDL